MEIPKNGDFVIEEVYWLSQNPGFKKDLTRIKNNYEINTNNLVDYGSYEKWSNKLSIKKQIKLDEDMTHMMKRCRAYHSRHRAGFIHTLREFVLTGKLRMIFSKTSHSKPHIKAKKEGGVVKIEITVQHADTTNEEVNIAIKKIWKEAIKPFQNKLSSKKRLKDEINFATNTKIWKMHKKGMPATQIAKEMKNTDYTQTNISDILHTTEDKIDRSYS